MSESERRRKYRYDRVLIETARVLDPQFDDAVVFLSGEQVEMLRNVTQYLNRLDTYVSEQFLGYYLAPTAEEYDSILAIVANLEEKLMGNLNTIFGYKDTLFDPSAHTKSGDGDHTMYGSTVPSGELWRIETFTARNTDSACSRIELIAEFPAANALVRAVDNPPAGELVTWQGMLTLKAPSSYRVIFYGCLDGDHLRFDMRGYKMDVPE